MIFFFSSSVFCFPFQNSWHLPEPYSISNSSVWMSSKDQNFWFPKAWFQNWRQGNSEFMLRAVKKRRGGNSCRDVPEKERISFQRPENNSRLGKWENLKKRNDSGSLLKGQLMRDHMSGKKGYKRLCLSPRSLRGPEWPTFCSPYSPHWQAWSVP